MPAEKPDLLTKCGVSFEALAQEVFRTCHSALLEVYEGNNEDHGFSLVSSCGEDWVSVPREPALNLQNVLTAIAQSTEYQTVLANHQLPNFDKRRLLYACNVFAPPRIEDNDTWSVTQIACIEDPDEGCVIERVSFNYHPYGGYDLWPLPAWCRSPRTVSLHQAYLSFVEQFLANLSVGDWQAPKESELLRATDAVAEPNSLEELYSYCKRLGIP